MTSKLNTQVCNTLSISEKIRLDILNSLSVSIKETFKLFFKEQSIIKSVMWAQCTPHFPDFTRQGFSILPREFSLYSDSIFGEGEGYTLKSLKERRAGFIQSYGDKPANSMFDAVEEVENLFTLPHSVFLDLFDEHAKVSFSKNSLRVNEYIHD